MPTSQFNKTHIMHTYIDTHAHLDLLENAEQAIKNAHDNGVSKIITINTSIERISELEKLVATFDNIYYTLGEHPCQNLIDAQKCYQKLDEYCANLPPSLVALGETGLDRKNNTPTELIFDQIELFQAHLSVAAKYKLPVVVHSRNADAELINILRKFPDVKGVLHCWTGSFETAQKAIDLGYMISFSGILTFPKKTEYLVEQAKKLPLEHIVIETDSPYLAPHPYRGSKNEPKNVVLVGQYLSYIRQQAEDEVQKQLYINTHRLFNLVKQGL